jgi:Ribonuclease G/E
MEKIIVKMEKLYKEMEKTQAGLIAQEAEAKALVAELDSRKDKLVAQELAVKEQAQALSHLGSIEQEQEKVKKELAGLVAERGRIEDLLVQAENKMKEADAKLNNAAQVEADILATRTRLAAEVKRVEERKVNLKKEIMSELAQGA